MITVLTVAAYTAIFSVVAYLFIYTKMFDWYRSPLGRVMNLSLIANAIAAFGIVARVGDHNTGRLISVVGWFAFAILVLWRLRILTITYHKLNSKKTVYARVVEEEVKPSDSYPQEEIEEDIVPPSEVRKVD